jgi:hypothetical protein
MGKAWEGGENVKVLYQRDQLKNVCGPTGG